MNSPISRRTFLFRTAAFAGCLLFSPLRPILSAPKSFSPESMEARQTLLHSYHDTLQSFLSRGQLPIIDVEHHWGRKVPLTELLAKMDRNGVALTWLCPMSETATFLLSKTAANFPRGSYPRPSVAMAHAGTARIYRW
jgi:hypothetical protein